MCVLWMTKQLLQRQVCYRNARLHRKLVGLRKPVIQMIGCYKISGLASFARLSKEWGPPLLGQPANEIGGEASYCNY